MKHLLEAKWHRLENIELSNTFKGDSALNLLKVNSWTKLQYIYLRKNEESQGKI
jgi:hypothetical protein